MRLIFSTIALLLATIVLGVPVPSISGHALTDGASTSEYTLAQHHHLHSSNHAEHTFHHEETEVEARSLPNTSHKPGPSNHADMRNQAQKANDAGKPLPAPPQNPIHFNPKDVANSAKKVVKAPYDAVRSKISQTVTPNRGTSEYHSKGGNIRYASSKDNRGNPLDITPYRG